MSKFLSFVLLVAVGWIIRAVLIVIGSECLGLEVGVPVALALSALCSVWGGVGSTLGATFAAVMRERA